MNMSQNKADYYVLNNNLDFSSVTNYMPQALLGPFIGNGFAIKNLVITQFVEVITDAVRHYTSLFTTTNFANISNLVLNNVSVY
jgi:hypothetical protein